MIELSGFFIDMEIVITLLASVTLLATLVPILKHEHWVVRMFDFPYVQFTVLNLVVLGACLLFTPYGNMYDGFWIAALSISLVYRVWIIFPYTRFAHKKVPDLKTSKNELSLKVISYNVLMYNENYNGIIHAIEEENPDMVLLVETDKKWKEAVGNSFEDKLRFKVEIPLDNTYGMLFYSRFPLSKTKISCLVEDDVPSIDTLVHVQKDTTIRFFGLHPKPPSPTQNETSLPRDAELIQIGKKAQKCELPVMIAGDLNDVAWSHTTRLFIRISELLDPRMGRGFFNTYHAKHPLLRWPLDHLFLSAHFRVISMKRLKSYGSDHFPICAMVALRPDDKVSHNIERAKQTDKLEATEKLNRIDS
ncbi:MAG: endonuclease/exonuclease/phosphatase family protein [Ekhidna sp.]